MYYLSERLCRCIFERFDLSIQYNANGSASASQ